MAASRGAQNPFAVLWREFNRALGYLLGHGDWKIKPIHKAVVDHFIASTDAGTGETIRKQLQHRYFAQFLNKGRINSLHFYDLPNDLLISNLEFSDIIFDVGLLVDGRRQHAQISFYRGRIYSIDFKKPAKFFTGKDIRFGPVTRESKRHAYTAVIDRAEHGRETKDNP